MKYYIMLFCLVTQASFANPSFNDYFESSVKKLPKHADELTLLLTEDSSLPANQRLNTLKKYITELKAQQGLSKTPALNYFVTGIAYKNLLQALEELQSTESLDSQPKIFDAVESMQHSFHLAMQEDSAKKKQLTAKMYATIKQHSDGNDRIQAVQQELAQGGSSDNATEYWLTHWDVIGSLQDAGRYEEAEQALLTMEQELAKSNDDVSQYQSFVKQAKTNLTKEHNITKKPKPKVNKKVEPPSMLQQVGDKIAAYWLMITINLLVFISLIIAFLKREKD